MFLFFYCFWVDFAREHKVKISVRGNKQWAQLCPWCSVVHFSGPVCAVWSLHGQVVSAFVLKSTLYILIFYVYMAVPRQPPISMVTITRISDVLVHLLPRVLPSSPAICRRSQKKFTKCGSMTVLLDKQITFPTTKSCRLRFARLNLRTQ